MLVGEYVGDTAVAVFRGVPYAEPPLGALRWRAPQPLRTRLERRDAAAFAPACMQAMRILNWYRDLAEKFGGQRDYYADLDVSEDCLYLNVWTPTLKSDAKLPVMIWVHGGSNRSGWSYEPSYHGHALAERGVIVVSIAYRMGAFGFLSHPELDTAEPAANFGLWDIVAALQWVRENISKFGGDPERVTLFGESAGAENILALSFAEPAAGLFHRVILESTAAYGIGEVSTLADEMQRGSKLAAALAIEGSGALEKLRQVPADELLMTYEQAFADYYHSPAIDGLLLDSSTWSDISAANFADIQMIAGTNRDEWLAYLPTVVSKQDLSSTAEELLNIDSEPALAAVADEQDLRRAMDRLITADNYVCAAQFTAASMTGSQRNAWLYYFTRVRDDAGGAMMGAYHGAEYPYAFGTHDQFMTSNAVDAALTEIMMGYWTNFAATGNPNGNQLPDWPEFRAPDYAVQELGNVVSTIPAPEPVLCELFKN